MTEDEMKSGLFGARVTYSFTTAKKYIRSLSDGVANSDIDRRDLILRLVKESDHSCLRKEEGFQYKVDDFRVRALCRSVLLLQSAYDLSPKDTIVVGSKIVNIKAEIVDKLEGLAPLFGYVSASFLKEECDINDANVTPESILTLVNNHKNRQPKLALVSSLK